MRMCVYKIIKYLMCVYMRMYFIVNFENSSENSIQNYVKIIAPLNLS